MRQAATSFCFLLCATAAFAQAPYDRRDPGLDSYAAAEAMRQRNIDRQLQAIDQMQGTWDRPIAGAWAEPAPYLSEPGFTYITGRRGLFGRYRERVYIGPRPALTPWEEARGYLRGPTDFIRQPTGQRHVQTGPDRWESYPVYEEPVRPSLIEQPPVGPREF